MLFMILIGALMFAEFVNITTMPADLKAFVTRFNLSPTMVVAAICAIYVVLGTAMEELSMILLTIPVFFPVIVHLGFDPVWFGIIIVCVVEIGLISPPVGMNMFVLRTLLPEVSTRHRLQRRAAVHVGRRASAWPSWSRSRGSRSGCPASCGEPRIRRGRATRRGSASAAS